MLMNLTMKEYLDVLKSDAPAPGGGSVSALAGAQGAALIAMVADLTIGREKYKDWERDCMQAKAVAEELYSQLCTMVDRDTEAYNQVIAAYKLPKNTDEEKVIRKKAIDEANLVATKVPFRTMELCYDGLLAAEAIVGYSNPNAESDIGVAIINFVAGVKGAWLNVKINLPGIADEQMRAFFEDEGKHIVMLASEKARAWYNKLV